MYTVSVHTSPKVSLLVFLESQYTADGTPGDLHWMLPTVPLVQPKEKAMKSNNIAI